MKIGILTFHRAENIGAVLQASALLNYLQEYFDDVELIDYIPNNGIPAYPLIFLRVLHKIKYLLMYSDMKRNKEKNFRRYTEKYYKLSHDSYYGDKKIKKIKNTYDILISGSDQILNITLTGDSNAYYLAFSESAKKISYASSFGRETISELEINLIKSELSKFSALSVREVTGQRIIENLIDNSVQLVLDPVFLLSKTEWELRCNKEIKIPDKYIFVYSMEISKILEMIVENLYEDLKLPVIVVRGGGVSNRIRGKENSSCGPEEFLRYILNAECIVTNSFHGSAFSIIFEKKLYCIPHSKRNTRLENLLTITKQANKMINSAENYKRFEINGREAFDNLTKLIDESKDFLLTNIIQ